MLALAGNFLGKVFPVCSSNVGAIELVALLQSTEQFTFDGATAEKAGKISVAITNILLNLKYSTQCNVQTDKHAISQFHVRIQECIKVLIAVTS